MGVKDFGDAGEGQRWQAGHPRWMGVAGWVCPPGPAFIVSISLGYLRTTTIHFLRATVLFFKREKGSSGFLCPCCWVLLTQCLQKIVHLGEQALAWRVRAWLAVSPTQVQILAWSLALAVSLAKGSDFSKPYALWVSEFQGHYKPVVI